MSLVAASLCAITTPARRLSAVLVAFALLAAIGGDSWSQAEPPAAPTLSPQQIDQLVAPIALYPDNLVAQVFAASTYPLDVVQAARWVREPGSAKLKGDALAKALESKRWDPSIKALVQFPTVLQNMSDKLDWTQKLGEAFLAQQDELMDQIQFLRQKADEAGQLKSTKQQKVTKSTARAIPHAAFFMSFCPVGRSAAQSGSARECRSSLHPGRWVRCRAR